MVRRCRQPVLTKLPSIASEIQNNLFRLIFLGHLKRERETRRHRFFIFSFIFPMLHLTDAHFYEILITPFNTII